MGKRIRKTLISIVSLLVAGTAILPTLAKGETIYPDFDTNRTGSISLYKYVSNDNSTIKTDGSSLAQNVDEQAEALQNATGNYKMIPEQGVEFGYLKLADMEQVSTSTKTGVYYTNFDADVIDKLVNYAGLTSSSDTSDLDNAKSNSEKHYEAEKVQEAITTLNKSTFNATVNGSLTSTTGETYLRSVITNTTSSVSGKFESTNMYGKTKVDNLPVGLYLIAEINWESKAIINHNTYWEAVDSTNVSPETDEYYDIASPSSPFTIQLPMPNANTVTSDGVQYEAGQGWLYDVSAYPKNGVIGVHKDIITNHDSVNKNNTGMDTEKTETLCDYHDATYIDPNVATGAKLTHQIDVNIGDTVAQVITCDVPALLENKKNKTFKVTDNMTKGLDFDSLTKVSLGTEPWDGSNDVLTEDMYTLEVSDDKKSFSVTLTLAGLDKLDAIQEKSYLYVQFNSYLTKDALIGTDTYDTTNDKGESITATNQNTAKLTYSTDRTMEHDYYSNTPKVYTYQVNLHKTFRTNDVDYTNVGYHVATYKMNNGNKELSDVAFIQVSEGIYRTYNALYDGNVDVVKDVYADSNGNVYLQGLDSGDYVFTEVSTMPGQQLLAEPFNVRLVANKIADESDIKFEDGSLQHVYVWSGDQPDNLSNYDLLNTDASTDLTKGIANITVQNNEIKILRTGGNGYSTIYFVTGALMICASLLLYNKRRESKHA